MSRFTAYLTVFLAALLGGGSLLLFGHFLYAGPLGLFDFGLHQAGTLCLNGALSLLFFVQHSGMVRRPFRARLERFVHRDYQGAVYSVASGAALLAVMLFWQEGTPFLSAPHGPIRLAFRALFLLSLAGFLWGGLSLKSFDPLGVRPLLARLRRTAPEAMPISIRGAYRLVRHPLYLFSILMFWSSPDLTSDRLMFNLLWTAWTVAGAFLEERDLTAEFGDGYREYRRKVPMFIPARFGDMLRRRR